MKINAYLFDYLFICRVLVGEDSKKLEKPKPLLSSSKLLEVAFLIAGVSAVWLFKGRPECGCEMGICSRTIQWRQGVLGLFYRFSLV